MSDGRNFTQYTPACETWPKNMSSNQARRAMMGNAAAIIDMNRQMAERMDGYHYMSACFDTKSSGTALPEETHMVCDSRQCKMVPGVTGGLGLGTRGVKR